MAEQVKHTPTPWKTDPHGLGIYPVRPDGTSGPGIAALMSRSGVYENHEANAAHIVQCVNAHDELVAALREMVKQFGYEVAHPVGMVHDEHEAIRRAMAVIAKATGSAS